MADVHRRAAASSPRLTPEEVATRGFTAAFRGVSELDVRNFLKRVADEMSVALARELALEQHVAELEEQLRHPPVVSEERLLDALGEETARVLRSAQESAEEIRTKAEERAAALIAEAEAAATQTRAEADADAAAMRDAAQTAAAAREEEAIAFATETRAAAEAEVADLRARTEREITVTREQMAIETANEIEAAKAAGRELVNEARGVRERILADLGRRRMLLQAQIDELRAGRDRLLDAYRVVKRTLGDATQALTQVEARAAHELSEPAPVVDVPPVDGELAALAGELTGEAGPVSPDVEALFARLREQSGSDSAAGVPADGRDIGAEALGGESSDEAPATVPPEPDPEPEPEPEPAARAEPSAPSRRRRARSDGAEDARPAAVAHEADDGLPAPASSGRTEPTRQDAPEPEVDVIDEAVAVSVVLTGDVSDDDARSAREVLIAPLQRDLGRRVKRALQDEQNDVLDRIRTVKGRAVAGEVLPTVADQAAVIAAALREPVDAAYRGGQVAAATGSATGPAPAAMVDGLAAAMVERLHERIVEAIDGAGDDASVTQRLGARYREFKGQELDAIVGDTLAAAWALGVFDATPAGGRLRWVPSAEGRCPDCDDNSLEPTVRGEPFPTGQAHPPAHPGCRCLLVPQA